MYLEQLRARLSRYVPVIAVGSALALASGVTFAQTTTTEKTYEDEMAKEEKYDPQSEADEAAERVVGGQPSDVEEIVVTGSRIKRTEFNSTAPIQVITNERSQLAGLLDTTQILQASTVASGQQIDNSFSGFVVDGGPGANSISLRGLGAQRTLVLVNSKRWGPSGVRGSTNSVDLTAIPTSQIARYEIFKDGASSVYGADAVAGVVNAFTKERVDGSALNAQFFTPERGGNAYSIDGVWGRTGDNWSFNVSAAYGERERTIADDLPYGYCDQRPRLNGANLDSEGNPYCFGFIYGLQSGPFGFARYEPSLTDPADTSNPYYDPEIQGIYGIPLWTTVPLNSDPNQGAYYRDTLNGSVAEVEPKGSIMTLNSFGDYDFSIADRSSTVYYEFYYNKRETNAVGGYRQFFPLVPATNPTNIMGTSGPLAGFGGFAVLSVMPSYQIQDPTNNIDIERTNTFIGWKGDINSNWSYDTYAGYSWSEGTYAQWNWLQGQVDASLDAELDGGGNLVCSAASLALYSDCVAGDLFTTDALLNGVLPQDYLDFISKYTIGTTEYTQWQFVGYVSGTLFSIGDKDVGAVFGGEFRNESINDVPDIDAQNDNIWGRTTASITKGEYDVTEAFTEIEIPILQDSPLGQEMTLNGSWRYTDYSTYGGDDTYRIGFNWQITDLFRVRATTGTSFRAPDLFEQFLGNETGFQNALGNDVCIDYGANYGPATNVFQNCASQGLPLDFGTQGAPSIRTVTGGNPDLKAETSDSWTAGIVVTPDDLGMSLAVSMFDIELSNTVASPTVSFVIGDCYDSPNFSSPFCQRVAPRDSQGYLTDVDASLLNVGLLRSRGVDYDLLYEQEFASWDLTIDLSATQTLEQDRTLLGEYTDFQGKWAFPEWAADADIRADYRDWTAFYNIAYIGSTAETPVANRYCSTEPVFYHTVTLRYRGQSDWEILGTIRNLFDELPPIVSDGCGSETATRVFNTIPGAGYNLLGRSFALQLSKGFDF